MEILSKNKKRGFTLVELLVVIAIIGILSGIVLVTLGTARNSAFDARIQAAMNQIRSEAELQLTEDGNYDDVACSGGAQSIANLCTDINEMTRGTQADIAINKPTSADSYCAEVQLNNNNWCCVDSNLTMKCDYSADPSCSSTDYTCD